MTSIYTWIAIARQLATQPFGAVVQIEKFRVQHPRDAGMKPSMGLPLGQRGDWRLSYPGCGGLHVRDFGDYYSARLDRVNPECDPVGPVMSDTPQIAGGLALGALLGLALGKSKEAALVGAMFGGASRARGDGCPGRTRIEEEANGPPGLRRSPHELRVTRSGALAPSSE